MHLHAGKAFRYTREYIAKKHILTVQAAGHSDEEVEQDKTVVKTERHGKE